jgi:hypothetical protein
MRGRVTGLSRTLLQEPATLTETGERNEEKVKEEKAEEERDEDLSSFPPYKAL